MQAEWSELPTRPWLHLHGDLAHIHDCDWMDTHTHENVYPYGERGLIPATHATKSRPIMFAGQRAYLHDPEGC